MNPDQARQLEQFCTEMLDHLPAAHAPDEIWAGIERGLAQPPERPRRWFSFVAALAAAAAMAAVFFWVRHPASGWIETGPSSTRTVAIGTIGTVEIAPNTRLRVVADRPGEHRLALAHGEIHAKILAPPRLFFVDTAAGTAVDLGCEYSLHADADGTSLLQVTRGWVSFQWKGVESLVPAGASCRAHAEDGPGVPYFDDAPESLKEALDTKAGSLDAILSPARVRDTLTLWHLMWRVAPDDRDRVYDRIAALTPVPPGVSRAMVLRLDPATMARWKDELAWTW